MRFVRRAIQPTVEEASRAFPAIVLTGPRRAGKTTLLRRLFPRASYVLLEDPDVVARARSDPRGLLDGVRPPALWVAGHEAGPPSLASRRAFSPASYFNPTMARGISRHGRGSRFSRRGRGVRAAGPR